MHIEIHRNMIDFYVHLFSLQKEDMLEGDAAAAQALGPGGEDIVLALHLQHGGAGHSGDGGGELRPQHDGGHDDGGQLPGAVGGGNPPQVDGELHDHHKAQPEVRDGQSQQRHQHEDIVKSGVLLHGGDDARDNGQQQRDAQGGQRDGQRGRELPQQGGEHVLVADVGFA